MRRVHGKPVVVILSLGLAIVAAAVCMRWYIRNSANGTILVVYMVGNPPDPAPAIEASTALSEILGVRCSPADARKVFVAIAPVPAPGRPGGYELPDSLRVFTDLQIARIAVQTEPTPDMEENRCQISAMAVISPADIRTTNGAVRLVPGSNRTLGKDAVAVVSDARVAAHVNGGVLLYWQLSKDDKAQLVSLMNDGGHNATYAIIMGDRVMYAPVRLHLIAEDWLVIDGPFMSYNDAVRFNGRVTQLGSGLRVDIRGSEKETEKNFER